MQLGSICKVSVLYSGEVRFESRPGNWSSWLRYFLVFLNPSGRLPEDYIKLGYDCYLITGNLTYLLTELSSSWEATNCAATQELPSILWNPKVQYRVHKSPLCPCPRLLVNFHDKIIFYGEEFLAPRPNRKLEDHPLSALRDCLFNIFAATPP
jgi:hypothetical protein